MTREEYLSEAQAYIDASGLMHHTIVDNPKPYVSNGNGTMYLSEFYILLKLLGLATAEDSAHWASMIQNCMKEPGLLCRSALKTEELDQQDNYLAVLVASTLLNQKQIALDILTYGRKNWGFYNNQNPGSIKGKDGKILWASFLWRMPQLYYLNLCAVDQDRWYHWPLALYTAAVLVFSTWDAPLTDPDARRLSWLYLLVVGKKSLLGRLASKLFLTRLKKDYGTEGMFVVYNTAYSPNHILRRIMKEYWFTKS